MIGRAETEVADPAPAHFGAPALERGLRLLCEFDRSTQTLGAPEFARRTKLPRSTLYRLLSTLTSLDFLERTETGRDYRLGPSVLRLGFEYLASQYLIELGLPILNRLTDDLRMTSSIVVRDKRSVVYLAKVTPESPHVRGDVTVGTRLPAHATVLGRILLADLSWPQLRALYPEPFLETFSDHTPRTVTELYETVQADRARGCAWGEGFFDSSISTAAAPILNRHGHVVAALGVTQSVGKTEPPPGPLVDRVRADAAAVSGLLACVSIGDEAGAYPRRRSPAGGRSV